MEGFTLTRSLHFSIHLQFYSVAPARDARRAGSASITAMKSSPLPAISGPGENIVTRAGRLHPKWSRHWAHEYKYQHAKRQRHKYSVGSARGGRGGWHSDITPIYSIRKHMTVE